MELELRSRTEEMVARRKHREAMKQTKHKKLNQTSQENNNMTNNVNRRPNTEKRHDTGMVKTKSRIATDHNVCGFIQSICCFEQKADRWGENNHCRMSYCIMNAR